MRSFMAASDSRWNSLSGSGAPKAMPYGSPAASSLAALVPGTWASAGRTTPGPAGNGARVNGAWSNGPAGIFTPGAGAGGGGAADGAGIGCGAADGAGIGSGRTVGGTADTGRGGRASAAGAGVVSGSRP